MAEKSYELYEDNPDTYLSAVNSILSAIGQAPVSCIDQDNPEVMMILQIVKEVNKDVQGEGWIFNQEYRLCWNPDEDGYIEIPPDVLRLDISDGQYIKNTDAVRRPGVKPVVDAPDLKPKKTNEPTEEEILAEVKKMTGGCKSCGEGKRKPKKREERGSCDTPLFLLDENPGGSTESDFTPGETSACATGHGDPEDPALDITIRWKGACVGTYYAQNGGGSGTPRFVSIGNCADTDMFGICKKLKEDAVYYTLPSWPRLGQCTAVNRRNGDDDGGDGGGDKPSGKDIECDVKLKFIECKDEKAIVEAKASIKDYGHKTDGYRFKVYIDGDNINPKDLDFETAGEKEYGWSKDDWFEHGDSFKFACPKGTEEVKVMANLGESWTSNEGDLQCNFGSAPGPKEKADGKDRSLCLFTWDDGEIKNISARDVDEVIQECLRPGDVYEAYYEYMFSGKKNRSAELLKDGDRNVEWLIVKPGSKTLDVKDCQEKDTSVDVSISCPNKVGNNISAKVSKGPSDFKYKWKLKGNVIKRGDGKVGKTYTITATDPGSYCFEVSGFEGKSDDWTKQDCCKVDKPEPEPEPDPEPELPDPIDIDCTDDPDCPHSVITTVWDEEKGEYGIWYDKNIINNVTVIAPHNDNKRRLRIELKNGACDPKKICKTICLCDNTNAQGEEIVDYEVVKCDKISDTIFEVKFKGKINVTNTFNIPTTYAGNGPKPDGASDATPKGWHKWERYPKDAEVKCDGKLKFQCKTSGCPINDSLECGESGNVRYKIWIRKKNGDWEYQGLKNEINGMDVPKWMHGGGTFDGWAEAHCKNARGDDGCEGTSIVPGDGPMCNPDTWSEDNCDVIDAPGIFKIECEDCTPDPPDPPDPPTPSPPDPDELAFIPACWAFQCCPECPDVPPALPEEEDCEGKPDPDCLEDAETKTAVYLYDRLNHTYVFCCPIKADVTWLIRFDAIPPIFQRYITTIASVRAAAQMVDNPQLFQLLKDREQMLRMECSNYELEQGDLNYLGQPDYSTYVGYQPFQTLMR